MAGVKEEICEEKGQRGGRRAGGVGVSRRMEERGQCDVSCYAERQTRWRWYDVRG